ncbi:MAG TPA: FAD-binding protein [Roseiflexaceae bacterium]|nr:FAD-binding protein [Roseiflexaceae bacterium]
MDFVLVENEPLAKYTSWRIGGPARYFANAPTTEALTAALDWAHERDLPVFVLGGGTNLLIRDGGFPGLVLRYRAQELRTDEATDRAWIAAGAPMAGTARRLAGQGWAGLEWAEGLPGTIGGAVFGNAGCYGGDIASTLTRAWLLVDGAVEEWLVERLMYGYRTSALKTHATTDHRPPATEDGGTKSEERISHSTNHPSSILDPRSWKDSSVVGRQSSVVGPIVVAAEFKLTQADAGELAERMRSIAAERKGKTPVGSSCGSVFKNPPGNSAGRLIEAAGLKGTRAGSAEISQKHANYIVNLGGAVCDDILRLIDRARERVAKEFGIELELEVQLVGK